MRINIPTVALCAVLGATNVAVAKDSPLVPVAWLAGCWVPEQAEAGSVEHWLPPAGGTMFGVSRTVKNGKTVAYEFMQIRQTAEGKLAYVAMPSGQKETTFVTASVATGLISFENLQHDFPQRIIYRALSDDRLLARIEGMRSGVLHGIDFPMKRARCEAAAVH